MRTDYKSYANDPALMALCANCARADCPGICARYRREWHRRHGDPQRVTRMTGRFEAFGQHKTLTEWAEEAQVTRVTLWNRMRRGMTLEQAVSVGPSKYRKAGMHEAGGMVMSVPAWARALGVSREYIYKRLRDGLSMKEITEQAREWRAVKAERMERWNRRREHERNQIAGHAGGQHDKDSRRQGV